MGSDQSHQRGFGGGQTEMEPVQHDRTLLDVRYLTFRNIATNSLLLPMPDLPNSGPDSSPKSRTLSISTEVEPVPFENYVRNFRRRKGRCIANI